jgi:hypothetical protein
MRKNFTQKIAIVLMLVFVIGSAVFLYFFALKVDRKYSDLIVTEAQNTENINKVTYNVSYSRILLISILYASAPDSITATEHEWQSCMSDNDLLLDTLSKNIFLPEKNKNEFSALSGFENTYIAVCKTFFALKRAAAGSDSCRYLLRTKILPAYKAYLDKLTRLLELNNKKLLDISDKLTAENKNTSLVYLSIGVSPFVFLIIYLALGLSVFFYVAFLSFRHDDDKA